MKSMPSQPKVDMAKCTLCGACFQACPCHAIELAEQGPVFSCPECCADGQVCPIGEDCWCACEEACPEGAIECVFEIVVDGKSEGPLTDG